MSRPESYGGTCVMITVLRGSRTPPSRPDSRSRNSSSDSSLGVDHGVGEDQPMLTSWCHGVRSTTRSLTSWQYGDRSRISSISNSSSLPGIR